MDEGSHPQTAGRLQGNGAGGIWLHRPVGVGNYKALWTRDFNYMVEYAGKWMSGEVPMP